MNKLYLGMARELSQLSFLLLFNITKLGHIVLISYIFTYIKPDTQNFK